MLVLTANGNVARQLIQNETAIDKEYVVTVNQTLAGSNYGVRESQLQLLRHGLSLDGVELRPAFVDILPPPDSSWRRTDVPDAGGRALQHGTATSVRLQFRLREGRNRQIRRMCEAVGLRVARLHRTRIGAIEMGGLQVGCWRFLRPSQQF